MLGFFGTLFQISGGTFKAELLECGELTSDLVACLIHRSGAMSVGAVDRRTMLLFQLRDGRAVEVTEFARDLYAYDEAVGPRAITLPDARTAASNGLHEADLGDGTALARPGDLGGALGAVDSGLQVSSLDRSRQFNGCRAPGDSRQDARVARVVES